jgi:hypothetical protein
MTYYTNTSLRLLESASTKARASDGKSDPMSSAPQLS